MLRLHSLTELSRAACLLAALGAGGCSKPKPPTVTPTAARVVDVTPAGVRLSVVFDVYNPNGFPLVAQAVDGAFFVGSPGVELGRAHSEPASPIPAEQRAAVASELSIGWTNLSALAPFALSAAPVPFEFRGTATVGGERLNVALPFTLKGELSRAELVGVGLSGLGAAHP